LPLSKPQRKRPLPRQRQGSRATAGLGARSRASARGRAAGHHASPGVDRPHFALRPAPLATSSRSSYPCAAIPSSSKRRSPPAFPKSSWTGWSSSDWLAPSNARALRACASRSATLRVQKPAKKRSMDALARLEPDAVLVRHWGGLVHFARRRAAASESTLRLHGDFSLNVTNSVTAKHLLGWGLDTLTAAHDLDEVQLFALLDHMPAERCTVVVHHRIATFHTEHCVYAHLLGNGRDYNTCGRPCEAHRIGLRDHLQQVHPSSSMRAAATRSSMRACRAQRGSCPGCCDAACGVSQSSSCASRVTKPPPHLRLPVALAGPHHAR
jgi:hypothetical protein